MYTCTMLPVVVCFVEDVTEPWETLDWIVTAVFAVDIIVTFFSAFRNKDKVLVTDLHAIAINYLQFWFWIDLVATLPFGGAWLPARAARRRPHQHCPAAVSRVRTAH